MFLSFDSYHMDHIVENILVFPYQFYWSYIILLSHHDLHQPQLLKIHQHSHHVTRAAPHINQNNYINQVLRLDDIQTLLWKWEKIFYKMKEDKIWA